MATTSITIRMDEELKRQAETLFELIYKTMPELEAMENE